MADFSTPEIVAVAIRCSTDQQEDSPEVQRSVVEKFCAANNYVVPADLWFIDFAVSAGLPVVKRPAGNRMINMVMDRKHRPFTKIIIVRLDRFFRDSKEQAVTWDLITKHGCELVGAKQDLSNDTAIKRAMLTMTGAVNQLEREATGERIKEHNVWRHQKNLHPSGFPPYGLAIGATSNEPFVIVPADLARAIRVFEVFADTCGNQSQTARRLNAESVPPRRGVRWTATMVRNCVTRPGYRRLGYYDGEMRPKPDIIPETIPADLLARVDGILTAQYGHWHVKNGDGQHSRPTATYSGLVACSLCGGPMDANVHTGGRQGRPQTYFRCRNRNTGCQQPSLYAPIVDRLIGECLLAGLGDIADSRESKRPAKKPTRIDAAERIAELEDSRSVAINLVMLGRKGGGIDIAEFQTRAARIDAEIADLSRTVTEAPAVAGIDVDTAKTLRARWPDIWREDIRSAAKRELLTVALGIGRGGIVVGKEWKAKSHRSTNAVWTVSITSPFIEYAHTWTGAVARGKPWVRGGFEHS